MASYIDFLMYKKSLKWYKRLFWPLFLNDEEMDEFMEKFGGERTAIDDMRDWAYHDYMDYCKNPTQENKRRLDEDRRIIEWMREEEMLRNMSDEEKREYMKRKDEYYNYDHGYKDRHQYGIWI